MFIVGVASAGSTLAANVLSLAYISNTPILIASVDKRATVYANMAFGMYVRLQCVQLVCEYVVCMYVCGAVCVVVCVCVCVYVCVLW